jgi:hypothetical protein
MYDHTTLASRVERARSSAEVEQLLFEWREEPNTALPTILRHTAFWSPTLLLLAWNTAGALRGVLENEHRTPEINYLLARWAVGAIQNEDLKKGDASISLLSGLAEEGSLPPDGDIVHALFDIVMEGRNRSTLTGSRKVAFVALLRHPGLPAERVERVYAAHQGRLSFMDRLRVADHPNLPEERREEVLRATLQGLAGNLERDDLLRNSCGRERLRRHPGCRPLLVDLVKCQGEHHEPFLLDAVSGDFGPLFSDLCAKSPARAHTFLAEHGDAVGHLLSPVLLQPLLVSKSAETRLMAISLLGRMRPASAAAAPDDAPARFAPAAQRSVR